MNDDKNTPSQSRSTILQAANIVQVECGYFWLGTALHVVDPLSKVEPQRKPNI